MSPSRVHRNDPCPCGSGRKYKSCHGRSGVMITHPLFLPLWAKVVIGVVAVGAVALLWLAMRRSGPGASQPLSAPRGAGVGSPGVAGAPPPGTTDPAAYQYDPRTNRYWDPSHRHWHNGSPPDTSAAARQGAAPTTTTPSATSPDTP